MGGLVLEYVTALSGFITGDFTADEKTGDFGTVFTANLSTLPEGKKLNPDIERAISISENEDKLTLSDYAGLFGSIGNVKEFFREDAYMSVLLGGQTEFRLELIITSDESIRHQSAMGSTRFGKTAHQISYEAPIDGKTVRIGIHVRQKEGLFHWTLHLSKDIEDAVSFKNIKELYKEIDILYRNNPSFDQTIFNGAISFPLSFLGILDLVYLIKDVTGVGGIYLGNLDPKFYNSYGATGYFIGGMGDALLDEIENTLNTIILASDVKKETEALYIKLQFFLFKIVFDKEFKERLRTGVNGFIEYRELVFPYYYEIFRQKVLPNVHLKYGIAINDLEQYFQKLAKADNDAFYEYGYIMMGSSLFLVETAVTGGGGAIIKAGALRKIASNIIEDAVKRLFNVTIEYEGGGEAYFDDIEKISVQEISYPTDIKDISGIVFYTKDDYTDVILHYNSVEKKYALWQEKLPGDKKNPNDPNEKDLQYIDEKELADKIKAGSGSKTNKIRLLSCSDLPSAQRLLKFLGQSYEMIASNHPIKLYHDGTVETMGDGKWYLMKFDAEGKVVMTEISNITPPITQDADPRKITDKSRYVVLGVIVGNRIFESEDALLKFFTDISIKLKDKYPAFNYDGDGCYHRAQIIADELKNLGIDCKKVFVQSKGLKPSKISPNSWGYHVAPIVEFMEENNIIKKIIIDPSMSTTPLLLMDWLKVMTSTTLKEIDMETLKTDYSNSPEKRVYWEATFTNLKKDADIYFETPKNILYIQDLIKNPNQDFDVVTNISKNFISKFNLFGKSFLLKNEILQNYQNGLIDQEIINKYSPSERVICYVDYHSELISKVNNLKSIIFSSSDYPDLGIYFYETGLKPFIPFLKGVGDDYDTFIKNIKLLSNNNPKLLEDKYPELFDLLMNKGKIARYPVSEPRKETFLKDLYK